jgi:long-chain acyl-CoA synthetase
MELPNMSTGRRFPASLLIIQADGTRTSCLSTVFTEFDDCQASHLGMQFLSTASRHVDQSAVLTKAAAWSYGDLSLAAMRVAIALQSSPGFTPGARVVVLLPNCFEYIAAFYGTLLAGGVVVPVPPKMERQALERIIESTEASTVVIASAAKRPASFDEQIPSFSVTLNGMSGDSMKQLPAQTGGGNDLAAIFFTSGSTGDPKGVMLSHHNLISNAASIQQYLEINSHDRPLCCLPFYHAFGNSVLQSHLLTGATLILDGSTVFPETLINAINSYRATSLSAVPDLVRVLLERTSLGRSELPSLRYLAVAGGALPYDLAVDLAKRISPARLFLMYGQTEATARLAYVPPDRFQSLSAGCIGKAVPGVELEVVDETGNPVAAGTTGELRARGPNVMLGYWRDEASTAEKIRNGWLLTGDLTETDNDGWIYHRGRQNAIVKIAGFRVHPGDLEEFAVRVLSASQAVAVAYEAPQVGTRLALFVTGADLLTHAEIISRCRDALPRHMVPCFVRLLDSMPLNSSLKVDRPRLTQIAERESKLTRAGQDLVRSITKGGNP